MDNTYMLLGWLTGRRIAGQRKKKADAGTWETLYDGNITVELDTTWNKYVGHIDGLRLTDDKERLLRLTINGTIYYDITMTTRGEYFGVGNAYLIKSYLSEDTGEDFYLGTHLDMLDIIYTGSQFGAREAGTYQVKVEKLLKDPVAYLYNGVKLPKLPNLKTFENTEEDFEDFLWVDPDALKAIDFIYVYIAKSADRYNLYFSATSPIIGVEEVKGVSALGRSLSIPTPYVCFQYRDGDDVWYFADCNLDGYNYNGTIYAHNGYIHWSHTDIESTDGTYYVYESEPIPVFDYKEW